MTEDKLTTWDAAEALDTPEAIAEYIIAVFEDGDPGVISMAIGNVARAMSRILDKRERQQ